MIRHFILTALSLTTAYSTEITDLSAHITALQQSVKKATVFLEEAAINALKRKVEGMVRISPTLKFDASSSLERISFGGDIRQDEVNQFFASAIHNSHHKVIAYLEKNSLWPDQKAVRAIVIDAARDGRHDIVTQLYEYPRYSYFLKHIPTANAALGNALRNNDLAMMERILYGEPPCPLIEYHDLIDQDFPTPNALYNTYKILRKYADHLLKNAVLSGHANIVACLVHRDIPAHDPAETTVPISISNGEQMARSEILPSTKKVFQISVDLGIDISAKRGDAEILKILLQGYPAPSTAGVDAALLSGAHNHIEIVRLLLTLGPGPSRDGLTTALRSMPFRMPRDYNTIRFLLSDAIPEHLRCTQEEFDVFAEGAVSRHSFSGTQNAEMIDFLLGATSQNRFIPSQEIVDRLLITMANADQLTSVNSLFTHTNRVLPTQEAITAAYMISWPNMRNALRDRITGWRRYFCA